MSLSFGYPIISSYFLLIKICFNAEPMWATHQKVGELKKLIKRFWPCEVF